MSEYFEAEYSTEACRNRADDCSAASAAEAAKYREICRVRDAYRRAVNGMDRLGLSLGIPE